MRLSKTVVIVSLIASLISFCLYVSDANAFVLTAGQMNEVLLAVFGAGVSSFGVGLIEYRYYRVDSEDKLLKKAHLLISAIDGLEEFRLGHVEGFNAEQLFLDYLREEETNQAVIGGPLSIVLSHASRDALIVAIEHCDESQIAYKVCVIKSMTPVSIIPTPIINRDFPIIVVYAFLSESFTFLWW